LWGEIKLKKMSSKIVLIVIVLLIFLFGSVVSLALSHSTYNKIKSSTIHNGGLLDILKNTLKNGGIIELEQEQISNIVSSYINGVENIQNEEGQNTHRALKTEFIINGHKLCLKGFAVELLKDEIIGYLPIEYRGVNFVVSSRGKIFIQHGNIVYKPSNFKIGKIIIPKNFVFKNINKYLKGKIIVDEGGLTVNKEKINLNIDSISIKDYKIIISVESTYKKYSEIKKKVKEKGIKDKLKKDEAEKDKVIKEKVEIIINETNESLKNLADGETNEAQKKEINEAIEAVEDVQEKIDNINSKDGNAVLEEVNKMLEELVESSNDEGLKEKIINVKDKVEKDKKQLEENENINFNKNEEVDENTEVIDQKEEEKNEIDKQLDKQNRALNKMKNNLYTVSGHLSREPERQIINIMIATTNKLIINPEYNFWGDADRVMSIYNSFKPKEKEKFKEIIYTYVDMENAFELEEMFE
jgi:hypothetical protein